jgi:uncharacterized protein (DUF58 family)
MAQTERIMTVRLFDIDDDEEVMEERIERAATLADHFIKRGHPTGLWLPDLFIQPNRGIYQSARILEALALFESTGESTITAPGQDITGVVIDV